jgi:transposase InsO family protein
MNKSFKDLGLFRLSVLGPLASRGQLAHGELSAITRELASKTYKIPGTQRTHLSAETIRRWYYMWQRSGFDGLIPNYRQDKGKSHLKPEVQEALLSAKRDNPERSINTIMRLLRSQGIVTKGELSRASVHRFLQQQEMSKRILSDSKTIERRAFVAERAGQLWQSDVLHGPMVQTPEGLKKTYLISFMDDASRLLAHSAFCLGETALDLEGVLKQALLKRGLPYKLLIDNGPAYKSDTFKSICASLEIQLIYCRPREPESKGKIERFHRTFREHFLNELDMDVITNLADLNARLQAWIDLVYHQRPHCGLEKDITPLQRWQRDLIHIKPLGLKAANIDNLFYHRHKRTVRKDGTIRWEGKIFEVPHSLVEEEVVLVIDPHTEKAIQVESDSGDILGPVFLLDPIANNYRKRQRPDTTKEQKHKPVQSTVEFAYKEYEDLYNIPLTISSEGK